MTDLFKDLTWKCHICGEERPDALIGVAKHHHLAPSGVEMDENVRYCIDRPACQEGASAFCFVGKPELHT